jgi:hypothetical protein
MLTWSAAHLDYELRAPHGGMVMSDEYGARAA